MRRKLVALGLVLFGLVAVGCEGEEDGGEEEDDFAAVVTQQL
jgi:hypothetical protein